MPSPPASAGDAAALLERNPLLREVGRVAPDRLPWFLAQLDAIRHGSGPRGGKKEVPLTPRERGALAANPDLEGAFRIAPDPMLGVLRLMLEVTQDKAKN